MKKCNNPTTAAVTVVGAHSAPSPGVALPGVKPLRVKLPVALLSSVQLSLVILCGLVGTAFVDANTIDDDVYLVELIVLAHKSDNDIALNELWQQPVTTVYPTTVRALKKNTQAEILKDLSASDAKSLSVPQQSLLTHLPEASRTMNDMAMQMRLRKGYRLLFHEAWLQRLEPSKTGSAVMIEGGRWYDPYYELSGSISLRKNRYLHVDADLWLSEFVSLKALSQTPWHARRTKASYHDLPTRSEALGQGRRNRDNPGVRKTALQIDRELTQTLYEYENASVNSLGEYRASQVFALQEKRRLRSGEVHYLDHPKLGILIKLTRLEEALSPSF